MESLQGLHLCVFFVLETSCGGHIPRVHSGAKTLLGATCQSPRRDATSWTEQRERRKWADPGMRCAHTQITRGLGVTPLKLFAFPTPDILKRQR
jgi:hypothetical protein